MKPTIGPWTVEPDGNGHLAVFGGNGRHLLSGEGDTPLPITERMANARALAAVPDMIAEIRQTLYFLETLANKYGGMLQGTDCDTRTRRAALQGLLARIDGKRP